MILVPRGTNLLHSNMQNPPSWRINCNASIRIHLTSASTPSSCYNVSLWSSFKPSEICIKQIETVHVQAFSSTHTTNLHHGHIQAIRQESFRRRYKSASLPGSPWIRSIQVDKKRCGIDIFCTCWILKRKICNKSTIRNTYKYSYGVKSYVDRNN